MTNREYQICSRCVMDTSDSQIFFDDLGHCDHCLAFDNQILPGWEKQINTPGLIESKIKKIKERGRLKPFDCILGMSGGIDSSFLLHKVVTEFDLRPLVFHVDAGWNSSEAVHNIERIVTKLGLELYTEVINWQEMKDLQLSFFKSGVPHIDAPQDHAFFATMYKFADRWSVNDIITGGNFSTECIRNPKEWMYHQSDVWQIKDIHKKFGHKPLKDFPFTNVFWHKLYLPLIKKVKLHRLLDYIPYDKEEAAKELELVYDYKRYGQKHFESRFTKFYEGYWLFTKFGFDTRRVQYSSLILTNQMKREEALSLLSKPSFDIKNIEKELQYIANKLEISITELMEFHSQPNKTFRDYKNQEYFYKIGFNIFRKLGFEKGGKR